jgi:hypothetical protein
MWRFVALVLALCAATSSATYVRGADLVSAALAALAAVRFV